MRMRLSQFYCTKCGNRGFDVPRKDNRQRPSGHLKKLYCIHCHGNFDENGNRIVTVWQAFIEKQKQEGLY